MDREMTKKTVQFVAEAGAAYIVKEIIKNNVTTPTRIDKKIALYVGAFALAGYATLKASRYIDLLLNDIFKTYDDIVKNKSDLKAVK